MIPGETLDEILESLDLSRAQPGAGFLEALFTRFNARVPFENATKILRDREVADPAAKPRLPEIFWADHLAFGSGGTCFARVAAFDALLTALGFRTRRLLGKVGRDFDHAGLAVETPAGEVIADVGFPLPGLIPPGAERVDTTLAELAVEKTERGIRVEWQDGVPEGPRALELFAPTVTEDEYATQWRRTFAPGSRFLTLFSMRRDLDNRTVSYAEAEIRVDDRHSRLRIPVAPAAAPRLLAEVFGIEEELLERALAAFGENSPPSTEATLSAPSSTATLTAYLEVAAAPAEAYARIATPAAYRRLVEGVAEVISEESAPTAGGFRVVLGAPGRLPDSREQASDDLIPDPAALRMRQERRTSSGVPARSAWAAQARDGRTYLLRELFLQRSQEDLLGFLRNDSMRGRLAGALALDLLAWARLL
ncbi:MAG TPA: arylamine N-acetyltransferase [Thermoanaerobaculia bacterium]